MTEEEAKTKWCPMSREDNEEGGAYNRFTGKPDEYTLCLASGCMCWVWDNGQIDTLGRLPSDATEPRVIKHGHCGLTK